MKILILTGKFGMGHYQAALSLKETLEKDPNHHIEIIDWLEYLSPHLAKHIYHGYAALIRHNTFFYNRSYRKSENLSINRKPAYKTACCIGMGHLLQEKQPDLIISVLALCSQAVSYYKQVSGCRIPLITGITDITGHSEWIHPNTDAYTVGAPEVKNFLIQKGVDSAHIFVTGIPVRDKFKQPMPTNIDGPRILMMGGGLGMLPKHLDFYRMLLRSVPANITLITGKNEKLRQKLDGHFSNLQVLGYVEDMATHFQRSDLILTKPGGVTTFEAIYSETPIMALNPKLHQEKYNADFIVHHQFGEQLMIFDDYQAVSAIARCINDRRRLAHYKHQMQYFKRALNTCPIEQVVHQVLHPYPLGGILTHEIFSFNF